jgi:predicted phosphodiesterase
MRVALISDMHGNAVALDAALADVEGEQCDQVVSLGDVAQGGAQPAQVVDRLRELGCPCVFGNSDDFLLTLEPGAEPLDDEQLERVLTVARWSREELGPERLEFLRTFDPTVEVALDGWRLICCHASPRSNEEIVVPQTPREHVRSLIGDADAVAGGHVHRQWLDSFGRKSWISVGSVGLVHDFGQPLDGRSLLPYAEYAIVDGSNGELDVEFKRVRYDVAAVVRSIGECGMPEADRFVAEWQAT